jgi:hypothetical protein
MTLDIIFRACAVPRYGRAASLHCRLRTRMDQIEQHRDQDHRQHVSAHGKTRRGERDLQRRYNCWKLWHRIPLRSLPRPSRSSIRCRLTAKATIVFLSGKRPAFIHTLGVNWSYDDVSDLFPNVERFQVTVRFTAARRRELIRSHYLNGRRRSFGESTRSRTLQRKLDHC